MYLSGNTAKAQKPVTMSKPDGHTGGWKERQGSNYLKTEFRSKITSQDFRDNFGAIDWSKK